MTIKIDQIEVPIEKDGVQVIGTPTALNFTGDNVQVTNVANKANIQFPSIEIPKVDWKYLGEDSVVGTDAVALYQFDGTAQQLNDRSGNGYTLTIDNGTIKKGVVGNRVAIWFDGATDLIANGTDEDLRIVGASTVEITARLSTVISGSYKHLLMVTASGESLESNALLNFRIITNNCLSYFVEKGAGTNVEHNTDVHVDYVDHYFVITRNSSGTLNYYVDGQLVDTGVVDSPEKAGSGNTQKLYVGDSGSGSNYFDGCISSIRISNTEFSAAKVASIAKDIFGTYGITDIKADNIPILEYSSASQINIKSAPGASSSLQVLLNDGTRYRATSPLTVDLTVSGLGGLDTGSEASSTWYYIYLVPSATSGVFSAVASVTSPTAGGPTGYDIYRYVGAIRNDSSSNIVLFKQVGNKFFARNLLYSGNDAGEVSHQTSYTLVDFSSAAPATASYVDIENYISMAPESPRARWFVAWSMDGTNSSIELPQFTGHTSTYATDLGSQITLPLDNSTSIYRKRVRVAGSLNLQWIAYIVLGYMDGYLTGASQIQAQAPYQSDTKSPKGTWATTSTISFAARPGQSATIRLTLQDGKQRTMTTGTFDISNGVADWGYDEAASQGNSKWLYFYAVPKSGDDNSLVIRASDNPLSTGPTGYSNYKVVWKTYIDGSGNLINVIQRNNEFQYNAQGDGDIYSGNGAGYIEPETSFASVDLSGQVPVGASEVQFRCYIELSAEDPESNWTIMWSLNGTNVHRSMHYLSGRLSTISAQNVWYMAITSSRTIYRKRRRNSGINNLAWITYSIHSWVDEEIDS